MHRFSELRDQVRADPERASRVAAHLAEARYWVERSFRAVRQSHPDVGAAGVRALSDGGDRVPLPQPSSAGTSRSRGGESGLPGDDSTQG